MLRVAEEPYGSEVAGRLVAALHHEIGARSADVDTFTPEELAEDDAAYLAEVTPELVRAPLGTFVVAWLDGEPVGCGAVKPFGTADRVGEIKRMYTAPEARRRGVSRAILEHLEATAAELGYVRLHLETGLPQPEAIGLYESHGWQRIPSYGRYKDTPSSVCFAKDLLDASASAVPVRDLAGDVSPPA
jgi:GNAT superfamily N-acetyltransferase